MFDEVSLKYWQELRWRLAFVLVYFMCVFILAYYQSNTLYRLLTAPIEQILQTPFVALSLTDTITTPLKISWYMAWFLTVPCFFYHLFAFFLPALYQHEKNWFAGLLICAVLLYYVGVAFAITLVSPVLVYYVKTILPTSVQYMPDMRVFIDFMIYLAMCFGWAFELPMAMMFVSYMGWATSQNMSECRRYFILVAFIVSMFLTPPDVLSQCILAIPICLIFELGLLAVRAAEYYFQKNISALSTSA